MNDYGSNAESQLVAERDRPFSSFCRLALGVDILRGSMIGQGVTETVSPVFPETRLFRLAYAGPTKLPKSKNLRVDVYLGSLSHWRG